MMTVLRVISRQHRYPSSITVVCYLKLKFHRCHFKEIRHIYVFRNEYLDFQKISSISSCSTTQFHKLLISFLITLWHKQQVNLFSKNFVFIKTIPVRCKTQWKCLGLPVFLKSWFNFDSFKNLLSELTHSKTKDMKTKTF